MVYRMSCGVGDMELTRREMFGALGVAAGSCVLSSCTRREIKTEKPASWSPVPWPYHELDPETTAERAYLCYFEGHCMYAVFKSIVGQLADRYGEPYQSFPFAMMSYGAGGVASWGSLCGALNGAAAAIGLFASGREQQMSLTNQVFLWYEQTELPVHVPAQPKLDMQMRKSVAHSILCHPSVSTWSKASGYPVAGKEHNERCAGSRRTPPGGPCSCSMKAWRAGSPIQWSRRNRQAGATPAMAGKGNEKTLWPGWPAAVATRCRLTSIRRCRPGRSEAVTRPRRFPIH